jgi:sporadic carbohydrate cluster 2OG-Fe(II) oxygenase
MTKLIRDRDVLKQYEWTPDPLWDNKVLDYDATKHDWAGFFLAAVQELKPTLTNLEDLHLHFSTSELVNLRKHLEKVSNSREFSCRLDAYFEEYANPILPSPDYLIQATCGIRLVVPDQEKRGRLLTFHTGYWTGYSNQMYTIWTPLTRTWGTNSMQIMSWEDTIELMTRIHTEKLDMDSIQDICMERAFPIEINYGQAWLFNQGHLHGNVNNDTGITRMSFDARVAYGDWGPRKPGAFFRFPGTYAEIDRSKIQKGTWITFLDPNSEFIHITPHYMIREFLLGFANRLGIEISDWSQELWTLTWMPKLREYVNKKDFKGILFPSVDAFSGSKELRLELFRTALENGQQLIFADENLLISNLKELEQVERLYALGE